VHVNIFIFTYLLTDCFGELVVLSEQLLILVSCFWRPMSRNSILEEFNVNRLAVIQEDTCCRPFWRWV